jgi:hypothetical protein
VSRAQGEVEADSIAFIVLASLGLRIDSSSVEYVAGWSQGKPELLRDAAETVHRWPPRFWPSWTSPRLRKTEIVDERVAAWVAAINAQPGLYLLPSYGPYVSVEHTAEYFAAWAADQLAGVPSPALCRRCGRLLRVGYAPSSQLHADCEPTPWWPHPAPPLETLVWHCTEGLKEDEDG